MLNQSHPRRRLPPLNSLRAFEAVARLGSFTAAADELCVTPAAISQQIKTLEGWIGTDLFERHVHGVTLNEVGRQSGAGLTQAFDLMGASVQSLIRKARPKTVRFVTLPSIAQFWLAPRLGQLRKAIPNLEISVTTRDYAPNILREPFDFSLFLKDEFEPQNGAVRLFQDEIFPVCAPNIASRLSTIRDLGSVPLLSDETWSDDWNTWLANVEGGTSVSADGPVFSLFGIALQETLNGAGVLIGHSFLVEEHIKRGELAVPFSATAPLSHSLFLEFGEQASSDPVLQQIVRTLSESEG